MADIKPIRPDEVITQKQAQIPNEVLEACNTLISRHWDGAAAKFKQDELIELIQTLLPKHITSEHIFKQKWLDIEDIYREAGWKVIYDKPAYNETYDATFCFKRK